MDPPPTRYERQSYEAYYGLGHYDVRYPRPNPRTLDLIEREIAARAPQRIVDFGSGNGRYLIPLLARHASVTGIAVDASDEARRQIVARARAAHVADRLVTGETLEVVADDGACTVALAVFGVLGHLLTRTERVDTIAALGGLAGPAGVVVASVPNRTRRSLVDQMRSRSRCVSVRRSFADTSTDIAYQLFTPSQLRRELVASGLEVTTLTCESLLSEHLVCTRPPVARVDAWLSPRLSAWLGYGILAVGVRARPDSTR